VTGYLDAAAETFWHETGRIARARLAGPAETGLAATGKEPSR